MWNEVAGWTAAIVQHYRRQATVNKLDRLSEHLLRDIGLRREQLDLLRLPPPGEPLSKAGTVSTAAAVPVLQGCG